MVTHSDSKLSTAIAAVADALSRLEAAAEIAAARQGESAAARETAQAEITQSWQNHTAQLEATQAEATAENAFLREDNLRLSNQLQQLQQEHLELQQAAGSALTRLDRSVKQLDMLLEH